MLNLIALVTGLLKETLYKRVLERNHRSIFVASELEFPLYNKGSQVASAQNVIRALVNSHGYTPQYTRSTNSGWIISAQKDGNVVANDAGLSVLEISSSPSGSLQTHELEIYEILNEVTAVAQGKNCRVLGHGCHPAMYPTGNLRVRNTRYDIIWKAFGSSSSLNWLTAIAAQQCHVDVRTPQEMLKAVKVFNALSPWFIALFANCAIYEEKLGLRKARRQDVYKESFPKERIDLLKHPSGRWIETTAELAEVMLHQQFIFGRREKERFLFQGTFQQWVQGNGLNMEDMLSHESSLLWNARPRYGFGTVEVRSFCTQLPGDQMVIPALCLGIMENLEEASDLVDKKISCERAEQALAVATKYGMDWDKSGSLSDKDLVDVLEPVLSLAHEGLKNRGLREEAYLSPAMERFERRACPADEVIAAFNAGGMDAVIAKTSF